MVDEFEFDAELDAFLKSREASNTAPAAAAPKEPTSETVGSEQQDSHLRKVVHNVINDNPEEAAVDFSAYLKAKISKFMAGSKGTQ